MTTEILTALIGIEETLDYELIPAHEFEISVAAKLAKIGQVSRQVYVQDRGDGRGGRVDIVLHTEQEVIPIEIDRRTPRAKSIFKVRSINPDSAFVITRSPLRVVKV